MRWQLIYEGKQSLKLQKTKNNAYTTYHYQIASFLRHQLLLRKNLTVSYFLFI